MRPFDEWLLQTEEPLRSCIQALREHILSLNPKVTEKISYGMPFFYYRGKRFCYLWVHKKLGFPYIGIIDGHRIHHPDLIQEKRAQIKILLIDPGKDIPIKKIDGILKEAMKLVPLGTEGM